MSEPFAKGHCLCGAVSYVVNGQPVRMAQCHCSDCQRASGTGHMSNAFFRADDVEITGETTEYGSQADSGNIVTRYFCPTCGSRLFSQNSARPGIVGLMIGCVDDKDWFEPQSVVYTRNRSPWDITSQDVPNFETGSPPLRRLRRRNSGSGAARRYLQVCDKFHSSWISMRRLRVASASFSTRGCASPKPRAFSRSSPIPASRKAASTASARFSLSS